MLSHAELTRQPLFRGLSTDQVDTILKLSNERIYQDRSVVIRVSDVNPELYVVLEGGVEVKTPSGETLASLGRGSVFGEVSIVDDMPASATVMSAGLTRLAQIHRNTLHAMLEGDLKLKGQLMENLARILAGRLRAMNTHMLMGRLDN